MTSSIASNETNRSITILEFILGNWWLIRKTTEEWKNVVDEFTEISGELATHDDKERVNATISSGPKYPATSLNRVDSLEKFLSASSSHRRVFYGS